MDISPNDVTATLNGAIWVPSNGAVVEFNGTSDYVGLHLLSNTMLNDSSGTIIVQYTTYNDDGDQEKVFSVSNDNAPTFMMLAVNYHIAGNDPYFVIRDDGTNRLGVSTGISLPVNTMNHFAITVDDSGNKIYHNGRRITSPTYLFGNANTSWWAADLSGLDTVRMGSLDASGPTFWDFNGNISCVIVSGRAWTDDEILENYQHPHTVFQRPQAWNYYTAPVVGVTGKMPMFSTDGIHSNMFGIIAR
jgi:hypothetical protein